MLQPLKLLCWHLLRAQLQHPLQMGNHRIQGAVRMVWRTAKCEPRGPLAPDALTQHLDQARFANACLAAEQHHLPVPLCTLRPALQQQPHFLLASHQGRQATGRHGVKPRLCPALRQELVYRQRLLHPFESVLAQHLAGKKPLDEPQGGSTDHHRVGRRQPLQPGRNVGSVAQGQLLLPLATAHRAHDHWTCMHAHPHGQPHASFLL